MRQKTTKKTTEPRLRSRLTADDLETIALVVDRVIDRREKTAGKTAEKTAGKTDMLIDRPKSHNPIVATLPGVGRATLDYDVAKTERNRRGQTVYSRTFKTTENGHEVVTTIRQYR